LITGGAGFLGRAILRELARSPLEEVRVFDLEPVDIAGTPALVSIVGDVCDPEALLAACRGVDVVVHAASLVDWGHSTPERLAEVNVGGSKNVVRACREAGVRGLVYTSSMDVVCGTGPVVRADETTPYPEVFANEYSHSKALAEQVVLRANGPDLSVCALRPCGMFGEADPYHVANVLRLLRDRGLPFRVGDGSAAFQHVYVGNVAHAHVLALRQLLDPGAAIAGQSYFITDDSPAVNFFDFMDPIVTGLGYSLPPKSRSIPYPVMLALGAVVEAAAAALRPIHRFTPTLTRSSVRFVCHDHTFVGDKARRDLGYVPIYSEADAIKRTIAYFQEHPVGS
jgi:nucleoside-diphosphate-sugar epimerase